MQNYILIRIRGAFLHTRKVVGYLYCQALKTTLQKQNYLEVGDKLFRMVALQAQIRTLLLHITPRLTSVLFDQV